MRLKDYPIGLMTAEQAKEHISVKSIEEMADLLVQENTVLFYIGNQEIYPVGIGMKYGDFLWIYRGEESLLFIMKIRPNGSSNFFSAYQTINLWLDHLKILPCSINNLRVCRISLTID